MTRCEKKKKKYSHLLIARAPISPARRIRRQIRNEVVATHLLFFIAVAVAAAVVVAVARLVHAHASAVLAARAVG